MTDPDPRRVAKAALTAIVLHGILSRIDLNFGATVNVADRNDEQLLDRAERFAEKLLRRAGL